MSIAKPPVNFTNFTSVIPKTNKEFVKWTNGSGVICDLCKSKPFYTFSSWARHVKGIRHNKLYKPCQKKETGEIEILKKEIKNYKELLCTYSNKISIYENKISIYENKISIYENKISIYEKNNKIYVKELKKLKSDYLKLNKN